MIRKVERVFSSGDYLDYITDEMLDDLAKDLDKTEESKLVGGSQLGDILFLHFVGSEYQNSCFLKTNVSPLEMITHFEIPKEGWLRINHLPKATRASIRYVWVKDVDEENENVNRLNRCLDQLLQGETNLEFLKKELENLHGNNKEDKTTQNILQQTLANRLLNSKKLLEKEEFAKEANWIRYCMKLIDIEYGRASANIKTLQISQRCSNIFQSLPLSLIVLFDEDGGKKK